LRATQRAVVKDIVQPKRSGVLVRDLEYPTLTCVTSGPPVGDAQRQMKSLPVAGWQQHLCSQYRRLRNEMASRLCGICWTKRGYFKLARRGPMNCLATAPYRERY
jgi:hypothetical protein